MHNRRRLLAHVERGFANASWLSAIRIPREDCTDELSHTAQSIETLRPLLPILGLAAICYTSLLAFLNWRELDAVGAAWLAVSLLIFMPMMWSGPLLAGRLRANPITSAQNICIAATTIGLLWGSAAGVFDRPAGYAHTLACAAIGLVVFAAIPLSQMAFLASFAIGAVLFQADPFSVQAVSFTLFFSFIAVWIAAYVRFGRMKAAAALHRERFARKSEQQDCFEWTTDVSGNLTSASNTLLKSLSRPAGAIIGRPVWSLAEAEEGAGGQSEADVALGSETLMRFHEMQASFSDLAVYANAQDGKHRLSLTGQPVYDALGSFCGFKGVGLDLTEFNRSQERLLDAAQRDALTKLMNRASFNRHLERQIGEAPNGRSATTLLLIDLDKFKQANDTLGHQVGDQVLRQFSERLRSFLNSDGIVGRLGGDEFGVVLHEIVSKAQIDALCGELIPYLSAPYQIGDVTVKVGATIGVAICPEDGDTVDALVRSADLALYSAKARGGGMHRFYDSTLLNHALERRRLETDLGRAIENGQLTVRYQPIVDANSERLCGFEALVGWEHPNRGEVAADEFVPLAEATGLITRLGEWVLREACSTAARWPSNIRLAVNLSPAQFASPNLVPFVINCLAQSQLAPERLELEITESVFLDESESTQAILRQLHEIGVRWALDDFGTGYSSLKYLLKAPFSKIKIDREFVNGLSVPGSQKLPIVETIVALARNMGMETTAEGVESQNDLKAVKRLGCGQVQGFVYGPKLTTGEASSLAKSRMPIPAEGYDATRCEPRLSVLRSADVLYRGQVRPATVRNVSSRGAMIEAEWKAEVGQAIEVHMDHEKPKSGVIRWVDGIRFGVQFEEAVAVRPERREAAARTERRSAAA